MKKPRLFGTLLSLSAVALILLAAVLITIDLWPGRGEPQAIAEIESLGGYAAKLPTLREEIPEWAMTLGRYAYRINKVLPKWMQSDVEHWMPEQVVKEVNLRMPALVEETYVTGTRSLRHLRRLTSVNHAIFSYSDMDDATIQAVHDMKLLRYLDIQRTEVTDAGAQALDGLVRMEQLRLAHTRVADGSLRVIGRMSSLVVLDLTGTAITDAGLAHLSTMPALEFLCLDHTAITDAGILHLRSMKRLNTLCLKGTRVTQAGVVAFEKVRPGVEVELE